MVLDGCNKLVGHGLEPLRNSIVVKRIGIDLALESISTACVSSILDSIVGMTGNSLHEIEVTNIVLAKEDLELRKLLQKYNRLLLFDDNCSSCEEIFNRRAKTDGEQKVNTNREQRVNNTKGLFRIPSASMIHALSALKLLAVHAMMMEIVVVISNDVLTVI